MWGARCGSLDFKALESWGFGDWEISCGVCNSWTSRISVFRELWTRVFVDQCGMFAKWRGLDFRS